jgi:hypothetical protein
MNTCLGKGEYPSGKKSLHPGSMIEMPFSGTKHREMTNAGLIGCA